MDIFGIIILLTLMVGFGFLLYLIMRDPILMLKSLLRGLKSDHDWRFKIIFSPIWGPIWLIDKIFDLKLYIKEFEDASIPEKISFDEFEKYLLINTANLDHLGEMLKSFLNENDSTESNFILEDSKIRISNYWQKTVIKLNNEIEFASFNSLARFDSSLSFSNPGYNIKGILINKFDRTKSYFVFSDPIFLSRLIGKTYLNKKMYVELDADNETNEIIFYNSNIDYFKGFDFNKFENEIYSARYEDIEIKPST